MFPILCKFTDSDGDQVIVNMSNVIAVIVHRCDDEECKTKSNIILNTSAGMMGNGYKLVEVTSTVDEVMQAADDRLNEIIDR